LYKILENYFKMELPLNEQGSISEHAE
jgi:hypothetical protein